MLRMTRPCLHPLLLLSAVGFTRASIGVHVVEQHKDVLRFWPTAASPEARDASAGWAEPITLLHIDSHNDLMDVEADEDDQELRQTLREAFNDWSAAEEGHLAERRQRWVDLAVEHDWAEIGNFITLAAWFGLLDRVVWVRSDFPSSGVYNGPPPGEHKVAIELVEAEDETSTLCLRVLQQQQLFEDLPLTGSNFTTDLTSCKHAPMNEGENVEYRHFWLIVMTMEQIQKTLYSGMQTAVQLLHGDVNTPRQWVLDVDLDVFATYDPPFAMFAAANFSFDFAFRVAWLLDTDRHCSTDSRLQTGFSDACGCLSSIEPEQDDLRVLIQRIGDLPAHIAARRGSGVELATSQKAEIIASAFSDFTECKLGDEESGELYDMLGKMTVEEGERWRSVFLMPITEGAEEDFALTIFQGLQGIHHASKDEALRHMKLYHKFLLRLALDGVLGAPSVVTVSRSLDPDRYLPRELWPWIESRALHALADMLHMHGGHEVSYLPGVRPLGSQEPRQATPADEL